MWFYQLMNASPYNITDNLFEFNAFVNKLGIGFDYELNYYKYITLTSK